MNRTPASRTMAADDDKVPAAANPDVDQQSHNAPFLPHTFQQVSLSH